jgi:pyruvyltransferase
MRKIYWWTDGCIGHVVQNFGDELVPFMLNLAEVHEFEWAPATDADFIIAGSVLEHIPPTGWTGTVCGAGLMHEKSRVDMSEATVLGVRGKLTLARLKNVRNRQDVVLGDPALLVPAWVRQYQGKWDLGVIPHWSDKELIKRYPYGHLIDVRKPPLEVVEDIAKCKRIIASSLHGIIVADAYCIPRQAELFPNALAHPEHEGGDFKYWDYASIFDTHPHFGEVWKAPHAKVALIQNDLRVMMANAMETPLPPKVPVPHPDDVPERKCWSIHWPCHRKPRPQVSLLVPYRDDHEFRARVWHWLKEYWSDHLESFEIIQGHDEWYPFSKGCAINDAASRARGRVFVILDADAYLNSRFMQQYIDNIDAAVKAGKRRWYIPYNKLYRMSQEATVALIETSPASDYAISTPPPKNILDSSPLNPHDHNSVNYGHLYGALIQILPREAFFDVGGMDPRFRGWGSEDVSFMHAVDTIYCQHELGYNDALHLWHARPGISWDTRRWIGQPDTVANSRLAQRYTMATSEAGFMQALTAEYAPPPDVLHRWWTRDRTGQWPPHKLDLGESHSA